MKRLAGFALLLWILAGCAPSQAEIIGRTALAVTTESAGWTLTPTLTSTATLTPTPAATATPTTSPTLAPTITPTPGLGSTIISPVDGMELAYIPAGEFTMGFPQDIPADSFILIYYWSIQRKSADETPHTVSLDAFWIDRTEVTNAMYLECVAAAVCEPPEQTDFLTSLKGDFGTGYGFQGRNYEYFGNPYYDDYPVKSVTWHQAQAYCEWAGRRLPTEAEWEKAARGTDGRIHPWGNNNPSINLMEYHPKDGYEIKTSPAGSYPDGASPYGVLNMAGNVSEWVADWYVEDYYEHSPAANPPGPGTGEKRVIRGDNARSMPVSIYVSIRHFMEPDQADPLTGFRCALDTVE